MYFRNDRKKNAGPSEFGTFADNSIKCNIEIDTCFRNSGGKVENAVHQLAFPDFPTVSVKCLFHRVPKCRHCLVKV